MSTGANSARWPASARAAAVAAPVSASTSATTTVAPASQHAAANARPSPRPAPVTTTIRSSSCPTGPAGSPRRLRYGRRTFASGWSGG